ncbi:MAG TPA: hypothetical protein VHF69_01290 [Candidatus Synoicihabitans sp.]|nr:hypothetical protein [Candidatus Synoicihabitans sp.]
MKPLLSFLWLCALVCFSAVGTTSRAADPEALGTPAGSIAVPANLTAAEVQEALIKAADGRGWILVARDDERVVVRLDKNDWSARVTMLYTTRDVQFFSNSTRKGKPKLPEGWIKNLKDDSIRIMSTTSVLKT